jgi:peptidoglycan/xylan/chitin deacetylase (PgdA/CDA1 family)
LKVEAKGKLKVSLTHDVDRTVKTYQCLTHSLKAMSRRDISKAWYHIASWPRRRDVYWQFDEILEIETSYGVKSTFFFLIESYPFRPLKPSTWKLAAPFVYNIKEPRIRRMIKYLDENGWEIGLHGSYASFNDFGLLQLEKQTLEEIVGHSVIGIRQHFLNLNRNTWNLQEKAGFLYDSTWGFNDRLGFKENRVKPFAPFDNRFLVFPMAIMDSCYVEDQNGKSKLIDLIEKVIEHDGILVINCHTNRFYELEFPGYKTAYLEVIETCKEYQATFDTLTNFYALGQKDSWHKKSVSSDRETGG